MTLKFSHVKYSVFIFRIISMDRNKMCSNNLITFDVLSNIPLKILILKVI